MEISNYRAPPEPLHSLFNALCLLFDRPPKYVFYLELRDGKNERESMQKRMKEGGEDVREGRKRNCVCVCVCYFCLCGFRSLIF